MRDYCVSCAQMKILEQNTDAAGLSYYQMMENAGTIATVGIVGISMISPINDGLNRPIRGRVYCGKGNNGGDGFVVARLLKQRGWEMDIVLVDGEPSTPDAITNCGLAREMGIPMRTITDAAAEGAGASGSVSGGASGRAADVIIDAIYGTGFHGKLRENGAAAAGQIADARRQGALVFALDIPSGMGGDLTDETELDPRCVRADVTITFHAKKPVHLQKFAAQYCGRIITADIGIVDPDRDAFGADGPAFASSDEAEKSFDLADGEDYSFDDFVTIISRLRAPGGCPWDREQTHATLKKYLLEETQEAADAIDHEDDRNLCEELGDVLLQVVLHAQIARERGVFTMDDVIQGISEKMIRRHPWVFGDVQVDTPEQGETLWEEIKAQEKNQNP